MDTRTLKHFLALADCLHFGRASEGCHISPSALSRSIKQLEEALGVTLFTRDNRTVELTVEGEKFLNYARETVSQWELIRNDLLEASDTLSGELSMYCSVTASYSVLYDLLANFRQRYPLVDFKLHTGDPDKAIKRIVAGDEDITIAARPDRLQRGLAFKTVTTTPLRFIAPATSGFDLTALAGKTKTENWQNLPVILAESGVARKRIDHWFHELGVKPKIYAQVTGNEAIVSMVGLGLGIGIVPQIVLDHSPIAGRVQVLDIKPELEPYDVGLCVLEKKLKNPLVAAFWECIE
ncbi:HTH-type transcriptional activator IlvY [Porticoccus sp. W117]|uniref:HTH-type transcriptional activator IlvY n=1 Tax=Porticoccus sp. W117 TaxID=3054777 RepID=UPI00259A5DB8|nr:HTH-type transcriptional activator IlvY [Porticoccus sp. W117]MDM3872013.1 HTH-type transcriptional activator IlvY [Porticoccus sp. W117]